MLNKIQLQGRLVADPELRHTQSGTSVASFRIAVDRDYKKQDGSREADFINIVAWRGTADLVSRYFSKGQMIIIVGRLQIRPYDDRDGNRRYATEVVADNVYFVDSKRSDNAGARNAGQDGYNEPAGYDDAGGFEELTDDDGELPF